MSAPASNINSSTPATNTPNTSAPVAAPLPQGGLASVPSSISFSTSCCGGEIRFSTWISNVVDFFRRCLAKLPLIGRLFANEQVIEPSPTPQTAASSPSCATPDQSRYSDICRKFIDTRPPVGAARAFGIRSFWENVCSTPAGQCQMLVLRSPTQDEVNETLERFREIQEPYYKVLAFQTVVVAENSTDDFAGQFYQALPNDLKAEFHGHIGARDANDIQNGVYTSIRSRSAIQAADDMVRTRQSNSSQV